MNTGLAHTRWLGIACLLLAASNCTAAAGNGEEFDNELSDNTSRPIIGNTTGRYSNPTTIPVCFVNGDGTSADERYVRDLVVSEFSQAGLCFTGWAGCSSSPPCPSIRLFLGVPAGRNPAYGGESYVGAVCQVPTPWTTWIRGDRLSESTIHEFGHAVGLQHEHARTDNGGECPYSSGQVIPEGGANQYYTVYDPDSVMNYCGEDRLTPTDIHGIRAFYGRSGPVQCGGGAAPNSGSSNAGDASTCQYTCASNNMTAGECGKDQYGQRWECDGTCLIQVTSCGDTVSETSTPSGSDPSDSCQFSCVDYNYTPGMCNTDSNGNTWYCDGTCLSHVDSCESDSNAAPVDPAESCQWACEDYNYTPGMCHTDSNGNSFHCDGVCLTQVQSCG